jgi:hypothetical protein
MATSGDPETVIARRKPSAMASTPINTPTTPAMPVAAVRAAPLRSGSERRLKIAMVKIRLRKDMAGKFESFYPPLRRATAICRRIA